MTFEVWKDLFKECLGNRSVQYCNEVVPLLLAVDQGIKPTLLWDVCTPDTYALLSLIKQAIEKELLSTKLTVVELDLDVFIVNSSALVRTVNTILSSNLTWLIDLSGSEPKVATKEAHNGFKLHLVSLLTQLGLSNGVNSATNLNNSSNSTDEASSSSNTMTPKSNERNLDSAVLVRLPEDTNLSTVFGCMLGYPHIYWWPGESDEKCLTGTPLKVFKLSATCSIDNNPVELYSYSVPENLEKDLRPGIEIWGNKVNVLVEQSKIFSAASFNCDSVLCLSVSL